MYQTHRPPLSQPELFENMCRDYGSPEVIGMLVSCFGQEATGKALEQLGAAIAMSGVTLINIYARNRSFEPRGEQL